MNFIILPKAEPAPTDIMVFSFYAHDPGFYHGHLQMLGSYAGNPYEDDDFRLLLDRVRGRLMMRGVRYSQSVSRLNLKEYRKLTAEQKYQRRASKLFNRFTEQVQEIRHSSSLFKEEEEAKLQQEYLEAVEKNKAIYQEQLKE